MPLEVDTAKMAKIGEAALTFVGEQAKQHGVEEAIVMVSVAISAMAMMAACPKEAHDAIAEMLNSAIDDMQGGASYPLCRLLRPVPHPMLSGVVLELLRTEIDMLELATGESQDNVNDRAVANALELLIQWNQAAIPEPAPGLADSHANLQATLATVMDSVDYTAGACAVTEMVGGVLPKEVIDLAKTALTKARNVAQRG